MNAKIENRLPIYYVPVVATTANLFLTEYNKMDIELQTGRLPSEIVAETVPVDWIVYDFPVSENLQVTHPEDSEYIGWGPGDDYRRRFKVKSVAIVTSSALIRFLNQLNLIGST